MPYYDDNEANWEGPQGCPPSCDKDTSHFHCDGPVEGDTVRYDSSRLGAGQAKVTAHWHYDGCMIKVEGLTHSLCPSLGDSVYVLTDQ